MPSAIALQFAGKRFTRGPRLFESNLVEATLPDDDFDSGTEDIMPGLSIITGIDVAGVFNMSEANCNPTPTRHTLCRSRPNRGED